MQLGVLIDTKDVPVPVAGVVVVSNKRGPNQFDDVWNMPPRWCMEYATGQKIILGKKKSGPASWGECWTLGKVVGNSGKNAWYVPNQLPLKAFHATTIQGSVLGSHSGIRQKTMVKEMTINFL